MQNKRSQWKTQFNEIESASGFHQYVRKIFALDPFFRNLHCFQEVPIASLVSGYHYNHYVDWYIEELNTTLELHGEQHYKVINFGNKPHEQAQIDLHRIQYRDNLKMTALIEAGYNHKEISYADRDKLCASWLKELLCS